VIRVSAIALLLAACGSEEHLDVTVVSPSDTPVDRVIVWILRSDVCDSAAFEEVSVVAVAELDPLTSATSGCETVELAPDTYAVMAVGFGTSPSDPRCGARSRDCENVTVVEDEPVAPVELQLVRAGEGCGGLPFCLAFQTDQACSDALFDRELCTVVTE
jgi:hypothetical protein